MCSMYNRIMKRIGLYNPTDTSHLDKAKQKAKKKAKNRGIMGSVSKCGTTISTLNPPKQPKPINWSRKSQNQNN